MSCFLDHNPPTRPPALSLNKQTAARPPSSSTTRTPSRRAAGTPSSCCLGRRPRAVEAGRPPRPRPRPGPPAPCPCSRPPPPAPTPPPGGGSPSSGCPPLRTCKPTAPACTCWTRRRGRTRCAWTTWGGCLLWGVRRRRRCRPAARRARLRLLLLHPARPWTGGPGSRRSCGRWPCWRTGWVAGGEARKRGVVVVVAVVVEGRWQSSGTAPGGDGRAGWSWPSERMAAMAVAAPPRPPPRPPRSSCCSGGRRWSWRPPPAPPGLSLGAWRGGHAPCFG